MKLRGHHDQTWAARILALGLCSLSLHACTLLQPVASTLHRERPPVQITLMKWRWLP